MASPPKFHITLHQENRFLTGCIYLFSVTELPTVSLISICLRIGNEVLLETTDVQRLPGLAWLLSSLQKLQLPNKQLPYRSVSKGKMHKKLWKMIPLFTHLCQYLSGKYIPFFKRSIPFMGRNGKSQEPCSLKTKCTGSRRLLNR